MGIITDIRLDCHLFPERKFRFIPDKLPELCRMRDQRQTRLQFEILTLRHGPAPEDLLALLLEQLWS